MGTKTKVIIIAVSLLASYAFGRWSAPEKVKIETKIVEVEKKVKHEDKKSEKHKKTTIVEITLPDGSKQKTTTITDDTETESKTKETDTAKRSETDTKEVTRSSSKVTVSALAGAFVNKFGLPVYGVAVSKPVLGPITVGAFGFQNGMGGLSVGLTF